MHGVSVLSTSSWYGAFVRYPHLSALVSCRPRPRRTLLFTISSTICSFPPLSSTVRSCSFVYWRSRVRRYDVDSLSFPFPPLSSHLVSSSQAVHIPSIGARSLELPLCVRIWHSSGRCCICTYIFARCLLVQYSHRYYLYASSPPFCFCVISDHLATDSEINHTSYHDIIRSLGLAT